MHGFGGARRAERESIMPETHLLSFDCEEPFADIPPDQCDRMLLRIR